MRRLRPCPPPRAGTRCRWRPGPRCLGCAADQRFDVPAQLLVRLPGECLLGHHRRAVSLEHGPHPGHRVELPPDEALLQPDPGGQPGKQRPDGLLLPHQNGLGSSAGGGGAYLAATSTSCFPKLVGVQLAMPTMPPALRTRNSSAATTSGCGANIAPNTEVTQSKRPSAKGSCSASAWTHRMARPSARVRVRPSWTRAGVRSEATTRAPLRAAAIAQLPFRRPRPARLGRPRCGRPGPARGRLAPAASRWGGSRQGSRPPWSAVSAVRSRGPWSQPNRFTLGRGAWTQPCAGQGGRAA
jgi:hypothetical protein